MIRLPVLRLLAAMTARNTEIRLPYSSPVFTSGSFLLESDGTDRSASLKEISLFEQGFLGVTGGVYSNGTSLTGKLVFKIPSYMVDSRKLPSGVTQEGHEIILPVKISGTPESPQDNSAGMFQEEAPRTGPPGNAYRSFPWNSSSSSVKFLSFPYYGRRIHVILPGLHVAAQSYCSENI